MLDWDTDGADWPHRARSRFVTAAGLRWHLQHWPAPRPGAPRLWLLHGTGASTHSWQALVLRLAGHAEIWACDLPGHGFSAPVPGRELSLAALASRVASLIAELHAPPDALVGHSAGAAIALQMVLAEGLAPRAVASINGAFLPFGGAAAPLFTPLARLLHALPGVPQLFSARAADPAVVRRLVEGTGSTLDDAGLARYGRLIRDPDHARAALGMMAHWDLRPLAAALPRLARPLHLLAAANDRAVPPGQARRVAERVPGAEFTVLPRGGHLVHEEMPQAVADWIAPRLGAAAVVA